MISPEAQPPGGGASAAPKGFRFPVLTDAEIENMPDPDWLVDDLLPARGLILLYGPPAAGKTFTALGVAYSVATASRWAGRATTPGAIIYVVAEGVAGLAKRSRAWKQAHGLTNVERVYLVSDAVQLHRPNEVETFVKEMRSQVAEPIALVVFDTLARCFLGADENSAKEAGMLIDGAERVRKGLDAAVMLVHHTTKGGDAERGSSVLRGAVDTMLELSGAGGAITLKCEKQKEARAFPPIRLQLAAVGESCVMEVLADGSSPTTGRLLDVLSALADARTDGLSCTDWLDASGLPDTTFYRYRRDLEKRGLVQESEQVYRVTAEGLSALGATASAN